jgi:GT2 family glycosyltransferase
MTIKSNVVAIIVTFNRKELLINSLRTLYSQTIKPELIILIDNASSDGTEEYIYKNLAQEELACVEYIRLNQNVGGAGGFSVGIEKAIKTNCEWFLLIDDDVELEKEALENCLEYKNTYKCMQMNRKDVEGKVFSWDQTYIPHLNIIQKKLIDRTEEISFVNVFCFEGLMINREVINKIGLPPSDYFLRWDDLIYGYLCSRYYNIALIKKSIINRKLPFVAHNKNKLSLYYEIRNRVWTRKIVQKIEKYNSLIKVFALILEAAFVLKYAVKEFKSLKYILKGYWEGIFHSSESQQRYTK